MLTDMLFCICMLILKHLFIHPVNEKKTELNELSELKYLKSPAMLTDMPLFICLLKHVSKYSLQLKSEKKMN